MITEKEMECKEIAERIMMERVIRPGLVEEAVHNNAINFLRGIEKMARRFTFNDLSVRAKVNCADQFINIMVAYTTEWDDEYDLDDLAVTIDEWVGDQLYFDKNGDWYDEGRKVR